ncbi:MAG: DUF3551 domain-containing protein [Hyphomicrobiales bacterium]|nr:DUF3551 domain-containing protein [Hyphomicrobiales bacterium]
MIKVPIIALISAILAGLIVDASSTSAQAGAWCLVEYWDRDCSYNTFQQCLDSRAGGSTFCEKNPWSAVRSPRSPTRSGQRR